MKYFGTDGIRGVVNHNLNNKTIKKVANALVRFYKDKSKKVLLVGNDSRISSDYILSVLETVLLKHGIEIHNIGMCSSPCLAFLTKKFNYPLSLMLSASHNPSEYNGIKFFNSNAEKVDDKFEINFERLMDMRPLKCCNKFSKMICSEHLKETYINFLRSLKKSNLPCIIDCACGGASEIVKRVYLKTQIINSNPTGENINMNSGCTHIDNLKLMCAKNRKIGFALDGDADRLIVVDEFGQIIDGDKILYILSTFYLKTNDTVVGTIYSNEGLKTSLSKKNIKFLRAPVGDKQVYKKMIECKTILGGENSGHIILKTFSNTGDGVLLSIILSNILSSTNLSLNSLLNHYTEYFQIMKNIPNNKPFKMDESLKLIIRRYEDEGSRIIIRPSGTEPLIRVMVENKNEDKAKRVLDKLVFYIQNNY
ncbi:MAG TPA: hypothetical protein IAB72_04900 [Candidatus Onthoplasma faecipullorum]|nr:hypothetical protein [Candidatus Onthoplasma faecipullorum]